LVNKLKSWKTAAVAMLLLLAVVSVTVFSPWLSSPKAYPGTLEVLNHQKMKAMSMSVIVTAASTALTVLPDDTASSIANELADLSMPLFLIVCILYMEKFLLTTFGWLSFTFLIPGVCLLAVLYIISKKEVFFSWARKLLILAVALFMIIPISAGVTARIEATFAETVSTTFEKAQQIANETETEEGGNAFVAFFTKLADNVAALVETAKDVLSIMVDAVAVLLITSCVIPILTAFVFLWLIKTLINVNIPVKSFALLVRPKRMEKLMEKHKQRVIQQPEKKQQ